MFQTPNNKYQISNKFQISIFNFKTFGILTLELAVYFYLLRSNQVKIY